MSSWPAARRGSWGDPTIEVSGIAYDSRRVGPGDVFVAIPGFVHDGLEFAPDALRRGAVAIVAERSRSSLGDRALAGTWAQVRSTRRVLAALACRWHGNPSERLMVVGVTGTNGKTTVNRSSRSHPRWPRPGWPLEHDPGADCRRLLPDTSYHSRGAGAAGGDGTHARCRVSGRRHRGLLARLAA